MMRIGVRGKDYRDPETWVVDYRKMKRHGYDCTMFGYLSRVNFPYYHCSEEELAAMMALERKRAEEAGIAFDQTHAPWPVDDTTKAGRIQSMEWMKRAVRATHMLGCRDMAVHPVMPYSFGPEEDPAFAVRINETYIRELCDYASDYDVFIDLENMPVAYHSVGTVSQIVSFVGRMNHPQLKICLDTGHANVTGEEIGEAVRKCAPWLRIFHIHDNDGKCDTHRIPLIPIGSTGSIDWCSFTAALQDICFSGCLTYEADIPENLPEDAHDAIGLCAAAILSSLRP